MLKSSPSDWEGGISVFLSGIAPATLFTASGQGHTNNASLTELGPVTRNPRFDFDHENQRQLEL